MRARHVKTSHLTNPHNSAPTVLSNLFSGLYFGADLCGWVCLCRRMCSLHWRRQHTYTCVAVVMNLHIAYTANDNSTKLNRWIKHLPGAVRKDAGSFHLNDPSKLWGDWPLHYFPGAAILELWRILYHLRVLPHSHNHDRPVARWPGHLRTGVSGGFMQSLQKLVDPGPSVQYREDILSYCRCWGSIGGQSALRGNVRQVVVFCDVFRWISGGIACGTHIPIQ